LPKPDHGRSRSSTSCAVTAGAKCEYLTAIAIVVCPSTSWAGLFDAGVDHDPLTAAGAANLSAVPLHVEIRGADCLDCPAIMDLEEHETGAAPFSGEQTGFVEYCVSAILD